MEASRGGQIVSIGGSGGIDRLGRGRDMALGVFGFGVVGGRYVNYGLGVVVSRGERLLGRDGGEPALVDPIVPGSLSL